MFDPGESATEIFRRVHREIGPRAPEPAIDLAYKRFASANSNVRLENGAGPFKSPAMRVRISDLLDGAPAPVTEALAHILLGKLYRKPVARQYSRRYRLYLNRVDMRARIGQVRQTRGRKMQTGPEGVLHNLERIFEDLNGRYFGGMMARPALGWSHVRARTRLGHFDPAHNMIVISRIFDEEGAPRIALEYVMFHEMLHLHYPVIHRGSRRCVHTPEFKAHERLFPLYKEAKALLKRLIQ